MDDVPLIPKEANLLTHLVIPYKAPEKGKLRETCSFRFANLKETKVMAVDRSVYYNQWRLQGALGGLIWRCKRPSKLCDTELCPTEELQLVLRRS